MTFSSRFRPAKIITKVNKNEGNPIQSNPPVKVKMCSHLGDFTNEFTYCSTCKNASGTNSVRLKVFDCGVFGKCTIDRKSQDASIACCFSNGCKSYKFPSIPKIVEIDKQIIDINLPEHFNCGIAYWQGKLLLSSRLGSRENSIVCLSELDDHFQPIKTWQLDTTHALSILGSEDPRLFVFKNRLHIAFTGYYASGYRGTCQLYARLSEDCLRLEEIHVTKFIHAESVEKNWQFFEFQNRLHCVYHVNPHKVLTYADDGKAITSLCETKSPIKWHQTDLRGGAPPVLIGDEYYHWFHTFHLDDSDKKLYTVGLYTFSTSYPFLAKRCIPYPFMRAEHPNAYGHSIVFPCGVILKDGKWILSYGHNDVSCKIAIFNANDIEKELVNV